MAFRIDPKQIDGSAWSEGAYTISVVVERFSPDGRMIKWTHRGLGGQDYFSYRGFMGEVDKLADRFQASVDGAIAKSTGVKPPASIQEAEQAAPEMLSKLTG